MLGGTGFLVDNRHVLTCAHVVSGVIGEVSVTFPASELGTILADVVAPPGAAEPRQDDDLGDVAVLRLRVDVPITPPRLMPLTALQWIGETFYAVGYPASAPEGTAPVELKVYTDTGRELHPVRAITDLGPWIRPGFSGAAVYVENTDNVVGMIVAFAPDGRDGRTGFMMPLDAIARYWPAVLDLVTMGKLPHGAYRSLRSILLDQAAELRPADVYHDMVRVSDFRMTPPSQIQTVIALVEWIGAASLADTDKVASRLSAVLGVIYAMVDLEGQDRIDTWMTRYLGPHTQLKTPAAPAVVSVQVESGGSDPDAYKLRVTKLLGGEHRGEIVFDEDVPKDLLRKRVERVLESAVGPILGRPLIIEFVMPRGWLLNRDRDVDMWGAPPDFDTPLGWELPVVVRDLDLSRKPWHQGELKLRWKALREAALTGTASLTPFTCGDESPLKNRAYFRGRRDRSAVMLASAPDGLTLLDRILGASVPIILWPRRRCPDHDRTGTPGSCVGERFREALTAELAPFDPDRLPEKIMELRQAAGEDENAAHCGTDLTLVWDNPTHRPAEPPLGLA